MDHVQSLSGSAFEKAIVDLRSSYENIGFSSDNLNIEDFDDLEKLDIDFNSSSDDIKLLKEDSSYYSDVRPDRPRVFFISTNTPSNWEGVVSLSVMPLASSFSYEIDHDPNDDNNITFGVAPGHLPSPTLEDFKWLWDEQAVINQGEKRISIRASNPEFTTDLTLCINYNGSSPFRSIRIVYQLINAVDAIEIEPDIPVVAEIGEDTFCYFRFTNPDPTKLITIRTAPEFDENGEPIGDPDLYVSNLDFGLSLVTRENFIWKSTNVGADRVDIHPTDPQSRNGPIYMIGILGYRSLNRFSVLVSLSSPPVIHTINNGDQRDITISQNQFTYFKLPIDTTKAARVVVSVLPEGVDAFNFKSIKEILHSGGMSAGNFYGRGVYSLNCSVQDKFSLSSARELSLPPLIDAPFQLYPAMYISNSCLFPDDKEASWSALPCDLSRQAPLEIVIESDEWRHVADECYFSLTACPTRQRIHEDKLNISIKVEEVMESELLSEKISSLLEVFNETFQHVDGGSISQDERSTRGLTQECTFTYGEVHYVPFVSLLELTLPKPGECFYDLGCGTGKAVLTAAMTFPFSKCVGIELLDGLVTAAETAWQYFQAENLVEKVENIQEKSFPEIQFLKGSFLEIDWSEADVVYTSSICFSDDIIAGMAEKAKLMKAGSRFLTLKMLPNCERHFKLVSQTWHKMSWGRTSVYLLEKRKEEEVASFEYLPIDEVPRDWCE